MQAQNNNPPSNDVALTSFFQSQVHCTLFGAAAFSSLCYISQFSQAFLSDNIVYDPSSMMSLITGYQQYYRSLGKL